MTYKVKHVCMLLHLHTHWDEMSGANICLLVWMNLRVGLLISQDLVSAKHCPDVPFPMPSTPQFNHLW